MTPREKAEELYKKMLFCYQGHIDEYTAKQCALIAVDEILELLNHDLGHDQTARALEEQFQEVKQEIEQL
jgi:hypothetical protein